MLTLAGSATRHELMSSAYPYPLKDPHKGSPPMDPVLHWRNQGIIGGLGNRGNLLLVALIILHVHVQRASLGTLVFHVKAAVPFLYPNVGLRLTDRLSEKKH